MDRIIKYLSLKKNDSTIDSTNGNISIYIC